MADLHYQKSNGTFGEKDAPTPFEDELQRMMKDDHTHATVRAYELIRPYIDNPDHLLDLDARLQDLKLEIKVAEERAYLNLP
jgi:hypothetical protein